MANTSEETMEIPVTPKQGEIVVYDKQGKPHTMLRLNAHDMVQHLGWSYNVAYRDARPKDGKEKVVVLVSKKDAAATAAKPEASEQVELDSLDDAALRAFAKEHFDMNFDDTVDRKDVMAALLLEQSA